MVRRVKRNVDPDLVDQEDEFEDPEDEEFEEVRPRRGRRVVEDDDEDDLSIYTEDTEAQYEDDDDEDDEPPRRKGKTKAAREKAPPPIKGGWGEFQRNRQNNSRFPERWKPTKQETLTKFVDDAPFATYALHWFDELEGQRGWVCLREDCPGCDMGHSPSTQVAFNLIVFDEDGEPMVKVLTCGVKLAGQLENIANSKGGPLSRHYVSISKSGDKQTTSYVTNVVKERDVEEDWDIEPLSKEEFKSFKKQAYDPSVITYPSRKEFKKVVRELMDEV